MMTFNQFKDIQHRPLRIYNRAVMFHNILQDHGKVPAQEYAESFSKEERFEMAQMTALVKRKGPKMVKAMVTEGLTFTDEDYKEALA